MPEKQEGSTTGTPKKKATDNGVPTIGESASSADLAKLITGSEESNLNDGSRQDDDDSDESEDPEDDGGSETEDDNPTDDPEEDPGEEEEEDPDDIPDENADADENAETDDDGLDDLSQEEAVALARRQKKGVEKLRTRAEKLAEDLEEATTRAEENQVAKDHLAKWDTILDDPETAPTGIAQMVAYVAGKHGLTPDDIVQAALSTVKTAKRGDEPDFEEFAEEALDGIDFEFDDERERAKQMLINAERIKWRRSQAENPGTKSERKEEKPDNQVALQAKFDKEFNEAVLAFKDDYPSFTLTKDQAMEAVGKYPKLSVEDACFRLLRKSMAESLVKKTRKDENRKPHRMITQGGGRQGNPTSLPADQSKWTRQDWARAMAGK